MTLLDSKASALTIGLALLLNSAGCGSNDKGDDPKGSTTEKREPAVDYPPLPTAGTTSGPDGTSAGTTPTGPSTNGTPYGDGTPGDPPPATIAPPKPIDLAPKT